MISRRHFLRLSSTLAGSVVVSTALGGCQPLRSRDSLSAAQFVHGVASGDPASDSVLLWTRATSAAGEAALELAWELAEDAGFARVIRRGQAQATAERDYTVKVEARDLRPGTDYFYRFSARDSQSVAGRTRTLPAAGVRRVRLAVFSCANFPAGYFHAYREGSRVADLDAFVHLGDYLYEYGTGGYATGRAHELGRSLPADNSGELYSLADYRKRYALYRTDPDLQALHAAAPCIAVWDDHEVANDAWRDGAENHSDEEGDFGERKLAALRAWYEWLPVRPPVAEGSEQIYRSFDFGDLLSLHMLDTRIIGRDRLLEYRDYVDSASGAMDQERFRNDLLRPGRSLLGGAQLAWLGERLAASEARWQLLGQQVLMAKMHLPAELLGVEDLTDLPPLVAEFAELKAALLQGAEIGAEQQARLQRVTPYNLDAWDGYPVEREQLYALARQLGKRLVVLAGDTHNAWYSRLHDQRGNEIGVELATASVSSPGMEQYLGLDDDAARELAEAMALLVDELQYCNLHQRGFMLLTVTPGALESDWLFVDTTSDRSYLPAAGHRVVLET
ncbi:MAG: alkaline phosphatase D family protein [Haliea sp.]|uniref:alkaline phosphatase D family protein n=1 Tax=Haliea sp. TaxID=1932666 RepID=UPI0032EC6EF1